jgi:probable phosphoglycerate mutase
VGATLLRISEEHRGQTVVIVCHGGVIEGSLAALGNQPLQRSFDVAIENTSLTEWIRPPDDAVTSKWRLVRFNDAAHLLDGLG